MKYKITRKSILLPVIGLLAFFIYLYLFKIDISEIIATIQRVDPAVYLIAAFLTLLETFFFTLSWRFLLNFLSIKISITRSYLYVWYGLFMDIIIPAESISGEISRIYLISRKQSGTSGKVIASLITHRLMGMGLNIASLILGVSILMTERQITGAIFNFTMFLTIIITIVLLLLILLSINEKLTRKIVNIFIRLIKILSRGRWKISRITSDINKAITMFHDSMKEFRYALKTLSTSLFFLVIAWIFSMSIAYLVFIALKSPVNWSVILITSSIVLAIKSIPVGIPFEVGLPEITMTTIYTLLGVPTGISAAATILNRILTLWLRFFIGFATQQFLEIKTITESVKA